MVIQNWLSGVFFRIHRKLHFRRRVAGRRRPAIRCHGVATIEVLEPRQMLTAIVAVNDSYTVQSSMGSSMPTTMDVLANDSGGMGTLSISSVGMVSSGSVSIQHAMQSGDHDTLLYTAMPGFSGTDSFTYSVGDSFGDFSTATVSVTISNGSGSAMPQVTGLSAQSGSTMGGTSVTISGNNFDSVMGVYFGSVAASSYSVMGSGTITATAPSTSMPGTVDVTVVTSAGTSTTSGMDQFTYTGGMGSMSGPQVTGLSVQSGSTMGGTPVTISGTGFDNVSAVMFGGSMAMSYMVNSSSSITVYTPSHSAGSVDVTVVTFMGSSSSGISDQFAYEAPVGAPAVSSVSPGTATTSGGSTITISGTDFTGVTGVTFGGVAATSFSAMSATSITAVTPMHLSGQVDVQVTTAAGTSLTGSADTLVFTTPVLPPTVTGLSSSAGSTQGGATITILGNNLSNVTAVNFGSDVATSFSVNSASSITAVVPAAMAGTVDVTVTNSAGMSGTLSSDQYTYQSPLPSITSLSTSSGSSAGGATVTINGSNFQNVTGVLFGSVAASSFSVMGSGSISAVAPAEAIGVVDITVQSSFGSSTTTSADQFTFTAPVPSVTGLSVSSGGIAGGTSVTISGSQLTGATGVLFGTVPAASYSANMDGTITAVSPAESVGTVDVKVVNSSGSSAASSADHFAFTNPPPIVTGLAVSTGTTSGGTSVTITGSHFIGATSVLFGSVMASSFTVLDDNTIRVVAPAESSGAVDVKVTNAAGTSAASSSDQFTFAGSGTNNPTTPPPVVTSISIGSGTTSSGTSITIVGSHFTGATNVLFGGVAAASFTVQNDNSMTAIVPGSATGSVDVRVVTSSGTSATSTADQLSIPPSWSNGSSTGTPVTLTNGVPVINGLDTAGGSTTGGTSVTLFGVGFQSVTGVMFGSYAATSFTINSENSLTAVAPAVPSGSVAISLQSPAGTSVAAGNAQFAFTAPDAAPAVSGVSLPPNSSGEGSLVSIQGSNFTGTAQVLIGGVAAVFSVQSATTILAVVPAGVGGTTGVLVANPNGTSAISNAAQVALPAVNATAPSGPGNPGIGMNDPEYVYGSILVTNSGGGSMPIISQFHPVTTTTYHMSSGSDPMNMTWSETTTTIDGGTSTMTMSHVNTLANGSIETISSTTAEIMSSYSTSTDGNNGVTPSSSMTVTQQTIYMSSDVLVAANGTGFARYATTTDVQTHHTSLSNGTTASSSNDVSITTSSDQEYGRTSMSSTGHARSSDISTDISSNSANSSTTAAGVTTGQNSFTDAGRDQHSNSSDNHSSTFTSSPGSGSNGTSGGGGSTSNPQPIVTGLLSSGGSSNGGTTVVITGEHFRGATAVMFGSVAAQSFTVDSDTQITAIAPAAAIGTTDVQVVGPGGTSTTSSSDQFSFLAAGTSQSSDVSSSTSSGNDSWSSQSSSTYTVNSNGSQTSFSTDTETSAGNDTYADSDVSTSMNVTGDTNGITTLYVISTSSDTGVDAYSSSSVSTSSLAVGGTTSSTDSRVSSNSGSAVTNQSDSGWQQSDETPSAGGSASFHDNFSNSSQDSSTYTSSDHLTATNAGGTDASTNSSGDASTFQSSDQSQENDRSINQYGTPTVTATNNSSSDAGTSTTRNSHSNVETLGVNESDLGDVSTFASSSNDQDTANRQLTSTTTTSGQVGANEFLTSTETYTETDSSPSSDVQSDSGMDSWLPTGDTESDDSTQIVTSSDQSQVSDTLVSIDTTTPSAGSTSTNSASNTSAHSITNSQTNSSANHHTETSGANGTNNVANDHTTFRGQSHSSDDYTQDNTSSLNAVTLVAGGSILLAGSTHVTASGTGTETAGESGETNTANPSANNETDTSNSVNNDQGTQNSQNSVNMNVTDPTSGIVTTIQTGDTDVDIFTDADGQSMTVGFVAGNRTSESGQISANSSDSDSGNGTSTVSVVGNPSAGTTVDYSDHSTSTHQGGNSDSQQVTMSSIGNNSGSDSFSSFRDESTVESGRSNVTQIASTNDGQGNTRGINDSDLSAFGRISSQHSSDSGSETFANADGILASDDESEISQQSGNVSSTHYETTATNHNSLQSDPPLGLTTTILQIASSTDATGEQNTYSSANAHTASLSNLGSNVASGTSSIVGSEESSDSLSNRVNQAGVLPTGQTVNITNVYVQADNSQDTYSNASELKPDATLTVTNSISGAFNTPTLYDAQFGTTSTTDSSTGITTTKTFSNVLDTTSTDSAANGGTAVTTADGTMTNTPANSDSGTLQQAWSLVNITSHTDVTGNPIGTVTATSDIGGDSETKLNSTLTDRGLTDLQATTTTAASTTPPASQPVANPGELLNTQQTNTGNEVPNGDPQQGGNPQVVAVQQAAENLQNGVQVANEGAANAPGAAPAGNAQGVPAAQNAMAAALQVGMNGNIGSQVIPPPNVATPPPPVDPMQAAAAARNAQLQALIAQYGPLTVLATLSDGSPNRSNNYNPPGFTLYQASGGRQILVNNQTGTVVSIYYPGPAPGTTSIRPRRPGDGRFVPPPELIDVLRAMQARFDNMQAAFIPLYGRSGLTLVDYHASALANPYVSYAQGGSYLYLPPSGNVSPSQSTQRPRLLFRGERASQSPDTSFEGGIWPKGWNSSLNAHLAQNLADSNFIATSLRPSIAKGFAGKNGWLYIIRTKNGVNANITLGGNSPFPEQFEVAMPGGISNSEILGAFKMKNGQILGTFIPNPYYRPSN